MAIVLSSTGTCTCRVQFPDDLCLSTVTFHSSICNFPYPLSDFLDFFFPSFLKLSALSSSWWQTVVWHPQRLLLRMTCWFAAMGTQEQGEHLPLTHQRAQATVPFCSLLPFSLVKVCPPLFHKGHWKAVPWIARALQPLQCPAAAELFRERWKSLKADVSMQIASQN